MKRQVANRFLKGANLLLTLYGLLELTSAVLWLFTESGPPSFRFTELARTWQATARVGVILGVSISNPAFAKR